MCMYTADSTVHETDAMVKVQPVSACLDLYVWIVMCMYETDSIVDETDYHGKCSLLVCVWICMYVKLRVCMRLTRLFMRLIPR
jgi:hypothetical protein